MPTHQFIERCVAYSQETPLDGREGTVEERSTLTEVTSSEMVRRMPNCGQLSDEWRSKKAALAIAAV